MALTNSNVARGDRQKLCKALDDSKNQRFKRTHLLFFLGH